MNPDPTNGDEKPEQVANSTEGANWQYHTDAAEPKSLAANTPLTSHQPVTWTASEFVAHSKDARWYAAMAGGSVVILALVYLLTRDWLSVSFIAAMLFLLMIIVVRKPRVLPYSIDGNTLTIGPKTYALHDFKSFSVVKDNAFSSITFWPLKRFMLPTSIYYDPADEERIIEALSARLPYENHQPDWIDNISRQLHL